MKNRKTNWLFPQWMQKLDQWILLHCPTIWQTQVHRVLLYAVGVSILFFIGGYCWPNSFKNPLVAPIEGIIIQEEVYFLVFALLCIPAIVFWLYQQNKRQIIDYAPLKAVLQLMAYAISLFFILGITTTSFRMGTIYHTTHLMDNNDLEYIKNNNYFLYGFIPPDILSGDSQKDIEEGKQKFKKIKAKEDSLLRETTYQNRYLLNYSKNHILKLSSRSNLSSLSEWLSQFYLSGALDLDQLGRLPQSEQLYLLSLPDQSDWLPQSYLSSLAGPSNQLYLSNRSNRSYHSYRSYRSYQLDQLDLSNMSNLSSLSEWLYRVGLSNLSDRSDHSYWPDRSYPSELLYRSELSNWSFQSGLADWSNQIKKLNYSDFSLLKLYANYDNDYKNTLLRTNALKLSKKYSIVDSFFTFPLTYITERIDTLQLKLDSLKLKDGTLTGEVNTLTLQLDTLKTKFSDITFHYPLWFYQLEDGARSVEHAQSFWRKGIIIHYFKWLLYYLPFFCLLFLSLPFFNSNRFFTAFYVYLALFILMFFFIDAALGGFVSYNNIEDRENIKEVKEFLYFNHIGVIGIFISLVGLAVTAFFKQNKDFADFCFQMILVPLGVFFVLGLLCDYHLFIKMEIPYRLPNQVLWAAQGMGLVAVFLMGYIRSLPRG